jgi:hypothetical protein
MTRKGVATAHAPRFVVRYIRPVTVVRDFGFVSDRIHQEHWSLPSCEPAEICSG